MAQKVTLDLKFSLKVTHSFEKRRLQQIVAYNISTARDSEKNSIMANRKFQRAINGVRTLPLSLPKGGSNTNFSIFRNKI